MSASSLIFSAARAILPASLRRSIRRQLFGRFEKIAQDADGMLTYNLYARMYEYISNEPDGGDIVEIGGALGAGTITMALALKESGKRGKVITVEKMVGGSRDQYGNFQENLARYKQNLKNWKVDDRTLLFSDWLSYENGHKVLDLVESEELTALMCDADGLLHRDFEIFWSRLRSGGLIIIDDYDPTMSSKHVITYQLLSQLTEWGLFEEIELLSDTIFGRKPEGGDISKLDRARCEAIVEKAKADFENLKKD